ncbi:hypothetical protein [Acinetobacter sp.]|uniref:hypothetical protein n=1 Tax=Acinetobacter sp. TaxID=472 RepID=UPI0028A744ED|nr:hypothetical protein [Acinetobacter sp.]
MDIHKEREAFEKHASKFFTDSKEAFKTNGDQYLYDEVIWMWDCWIERAKAQAVPEGFVLIKDDTKTVVAIERMVEQQVEASGMDSRRLERLDGWKIIEAAVKAQEPAND